MRIAIFTEVFLPKIDGITNRLSNTLRCLSMKGHEVLLFTPLGSAKKFPGVKIAHISGIPFRRYPGVNFCLPNLVSFKRLKKFKPDVVHAVGPVTLGLWGMLAARTLRIPLVASYHTDFPKYMPLYGLGWGKRAVWDVIRGVHNLASLNLCPSQTTRRELIKRGIKNVSVWRGGVNTDLFHPSKKSKTMRSVLADGSDGMPLILYVGRLGFEKNIHFLKPILQKFPQVRAAIVGDGPARQQLEDTFKDLPVKFMGFLSGNRLASAYASCDIFFMPSTTETLGFTTLEAMSSGCAVLAADAGGTRSLVKDGKSGLLFQPNHIKNLLCKVKVLLEDSHKRCYLAANGLEEAAHASWENETEYLVNYYVSLAAHEGVREIDDSTSQLSKLIPLESFLR